MSRALCFLVLCISCSGTPDYQPIPVEDARALNTHLSAFYESTTDLMEHCAGEVEQVGVMPSGIGPEDFELQLLKNSLMGCFNADLQIMDISAEAPRGVQAVVGSNSFTQLSDRPDLGVVAACNNNELDSLESYLAYAPENIAEFIIERVLTVDELRVNLKHVLQERLNLLEEYVLDARSELVRLRAVASERYQHAMSSDGVTAEQQQQAFADHELIQAEFEDIERRLEQISDDALELRRYRRQLVEDVAVQLAAMGTPGG
jgi:hypothetical protein